MYVRRLPRPAVYARRGALLTPPAEAADLLALLCPAPTRDGRGMPPAVGARVKVVLLGDPDVGKHTLVSRIGASELEDVDEAEVFSMALPAAGGAVVEVDLWVPKGEAASAAVL
jgi:hypothetical protein